MILITGATGNLGFLVAQFIKEKNPSHEVAVLARNTQADKAKALEDSGFILREGTYDEVQSLEKAFQDVDRLYFVSGNIPGVRWQQHQNVVEAAKLAGVNHVFYTSVAFEHLEESAPLYGMMEDHFKTEELLKNSGLTYTFLRHNLYAEAVMMFLGDKAQLMQTKSVFLPTKDGKVAFVPRRDLAEAGANALLSAEQHKNEIYELNGEQHLTFKGIADILSEVSGEAISYVSPMPDTFRQVLSDAKVPSEIIEMTIAFCQAIAKGTFETQNTDLPQLLQREATSMKTILKEVYQ